MSKQLSRRIVNIVGGRRKNYHHGAFAADAFRREILASDNVKLTTYSYLAGNQSKTAQYSGMTDILKRCEENKFYHGFGDVSDIENKCKRFAENSIGLNQFSLTGTLNAFQEKQLICYIAGHGTADGRADGRVMCGTHGVGPLICNDLEEVQKLLIIVDACRGNTWAQSVPDNVSVIGAKFTLCLSSEDSMQNEILLI